MMRRPHVMRVVCTLYATRITFFYMNVNHTMMNKIAITIMYLKRYNPTREYFTAREIFNAQNDASTFYAMSPDYIRDRDNALNRHNVTLAEFESALAVAYSSFYATLPADYVDLNRVIKRICHKHHVFIPDLTFNMFTAHCHNATQSRTLVRRRRVDRLYEYALPT
jgi:hypothetical protein